MKAKNFNVLDLFSGIGGFSLGLERAGMRTVAFVEIDEFRQKVLKKHWLMLLKNTEEIAKRVKYISLVILKDLRLCMKILMIMKMGMNLEMFYG